MERIITQAKRPVQRSIQHSIEALVRAELKDFLGKLIETVILVPTDMTCSIRYKINLSRGDNLASPRGFEPLLPP